MLLTSFLFIVVIHICVGAKTHFSYDMGEAIDKFTQLAQNEPSDYLRHLNATGQGLRIFYDNFKSAQLKDKYSIKEMPTNSSISKECVKQITNLFGSLKNKELWSFQSTYT